MNKIFKTIRLIVISDMDEDFDYISDEVKNISLTDSSLTNISFLLESLIYKGVITSGRLNGEQLYLTERIAHLFERQIINDEIEDDIELVYEYKRDIVTYFEKLN